MSPGMDGGEEDLGPFRFAVPYLKLWTWETWEGQEKRSAPQDPVSCPLIGGTKDPGEETIKFRWSITP